MTTEVLEKKTEKEKFLHPKKFNVVVLNDDETPFDFVVFMLIKVFHMSEQKAFETTKKIHEEGRGIAGTYIYEIAYQKMKEGIEMARSNSFPLRLILELEN